MLKLNLSISSKKTSLFLIIFIALSFLIEPIKYYVFTHYLNLDYDAIFSPLLKLAVMSFKIIAVLFAIVYFVKVELVDNREKIIYKIIALWITQVLLYYHIFSLFIFNTDKYIFFILSILFIHLMILLLISWRVNDQFELLENKLSYAVKLTKKDVLSIILAIILVYFISMMVSNVFSFSLDEIFYHFILCSITAIVPMIINNKIMLLIKYMYDNIHI